jgi:hypothetical protein
MKKPTAVLAALGLTVVGVVSAAPAQAAVTTPSIPRTVTATKTTNSATLKWSPPASTGGAVINAYRVSRSGGYEKLVYGYTRSFQFTGLKTLTAYNLFVQARNAKGLGPAAKVYVRIEPAAKSYPDCATLNRVYPHGVAKSSSVRDSTSGTPVTTFWIQPAAYIVNDGPHKANTKTDYDLDRDNDGIACEKA